jgi:hypothetical protein
MLCLVGLGQVRLVTVPESNFSDYLATLVFGKPASCTVGCRCSTLLHSEIFPASGRYVGLPVFFRKASFCCSSSDSGICVGLGTIGVTTLAVDIPASCPDAFGSAS